MPSPDPQPVRSTGFPLGTALVGGLPIPVGMALGSVVRAVVLVAGGGEHVAAVGSILCTGLSAFLAAVWFERSVGFDSWWSVVGLSAIWALLTIGFRALWLGAIIGGGLPAVLSDYRLAGGNPGGVILAVVAAAPVIVAWRSRGVRQR